MKAYMNWGMPFAAAAWLFFTSGCTPVDFTVGGKVSGLAAGSSFNLLLNGTETLPITGNGLYTFTTRLPTNAEYNVTVASQPAAQKCVVANGSGLVAAANIRNATVSCVNSPPPGITHVWPSSVLGGYEVKISGSNLELASIAFNGAAITPTLQTSNELRFVAPENPPGIYSLELQNNGGFVSQNVAQGEVMTAVASMDAGDSHSCAVLNTGLVRCWGANDSGQLGNGFAFSISATPEQVVGISNAVSASAGARHSCAVLSTGEVQCWGSNYYGQLGNDYSDDHSNSTTPVTVTGVSNVVSVSAGSSHNCAVLDTGTVWCWGDARNGQLGNEVAVGISATPVQVVGVSDAVSLSAGSSHNCAVLGTGEVKCWGLNEYGQLGNGNIGWYLSSSIPQLVIGISNAVSVSAGINHSCAALSTGEVKCWGRNVSGMLGNGSNVDNATPVTVIGISNAVSVTAGLRHTCALLSTGTAQCWGSDYYGQLGDGDSTPTNSNGTYVGSNTPQTVIGIASVISVSIGHNHSCAALTTGEIKCWGTNVSGTLGNGSTARSETPVTVTGAGNAQLVSAGTNHNCAVQSTGEVQCWGTNSMLGNGSWTRSTAPVTVTGISNAVSVSAHDSHSCAALSTGAVQCWGHNNNGQLGIDGTTSSATPVTVPFISNAVSVTAGPENNCALLTTGAVRCWGYLFGYEGTGAGISNVVAVSPGQYHVCAVVGTGKVQCWGNNSVGQLGNGSMTSSETPVTVTGISNAVSVTSGLVHSCAVLSTGMVRCWGRYDYLAANGVTTQSTTPVTVIGLSNVQSVSTSSGYSCAVLRTGSVRCWGNTIETPVTVEGISDAVSVSANIGHSCAALRSGAVQCWGFNSHGQLSLPTPEAQSQPGLPVYLP